MRLSATRGLESTCPTEEVRVPCYLRTNNLYVRLGARYAGMMKHHQGRTANITLYGYSYSSP